MPADEALIFLASHPPIRAKKLRYYEDRNFTDRVGALPVNPAGADAMRFGGYHRSGPSPSDGNSDGLARSVGPDIGDEDEVAQDIASEAQCAPQQRSGIQDQIARYYLQVQENGGREL